MNLNVTVITLLGSDLFRVLFVNKKNKDSDFDEIQTEKAKHERAKVWFLNMRRKVRNNTHTENKQ